MLQALKAQNLGISELAYCELMDVCRAIGTPRSYLEDLKTTLKGREGENDQKVLTEVDF